MRSGVPVVTTIHWRVDEPDRQEFLSYFSTAPMVAISRAQASMFPPRDPSPRVIHHGIPCDRFSLGSGDRGYVAFIGRMTDQKGPDRAIDAARGAGMPIRLAGDVDIGNPTYFSREVESRLGEDAIYVGPLDDAQKQGFLGDAAVLAMPIDWPEPFGLVVIEAFACGTPVVAMRHGSMPELIEHGVTGFVCGDAGEFADALAAARTLDRHKIRTRFEARFTAERMAREHLDFYATLSATRRGNGVVRCMASSPRSSV